MRIFFNLKRIAQIKVGLVLYGTRIHGLMNDIAEESLDKSAKILARYPAKLPNQKYKRTKRLFRSWEVYNPGPDRWVIENSAEKPRGRRKYYAAFVVGDNYGERQAGIHQGRWKVARIIVNDQVAKGLKRLRTRAGKLAKECGL